MTQLITVDFESFYSKEVGFKKMTTEEYVNHPEFEVIGVAVKVDDGETRWFSGSMEETGRFLSQFNWKDAVLLCHNTLFDGCIMKWRFGITPYLYADTLSMARALHGVDAGGSLKALAERYKIGEKGTEVEQVMGMRRLDFTPEGLARYGQYCVNDVDLTYKLFSMMAGNFSEDELDLIDMTLRMFINPRLYVDTEMLEARLVEMREERETLLNSLADRLGCTDAENPAEAVRKKLSSNKQFAALLKEFGVEPPTKISPTTGKIAFALAKNDEGFIELLEHEDEFIQQLCAVRLGTKSTIEETRIERFIEIGKRNKGRLPIPLKYYGAHTGRWAGVDKVNFQNLPSRDKKKKALKNAVMAPEGYVVINCDSSQIEARVLAWLAGQCDLVEAFANKRDVYCEFASKVYDREITKANPVERFVGKTCILGLGYGTGAKKLRHTLKTQPPGADLEEDRCKDIVDLYRFTNDKIVALWHECERALNHLMDWPLDDRDEMIRPYTLGKVEAVKVTPYGFRLPNGLYIRYPNLRMEEGKYVYDSRKGPVHLWGGAIVENIVQALARIVVGKQMIEMTRLSETYRPVLTVHDAAVCVVPEDMVETALSDIVRIMSTPPDWAKGLPVACEAKFARRYGEC